MGFFSNLFGGSRTTKKTSSSSVINNTTTNYVNDATSNMDLWDSVGINVSGGINAPLTINDGATARAEIAAATAYATTTTATAAQLMGESINSSSSLAAKAIDSSIGLTDRSQIRAEGVFSSAIDSSLAILSATLGDAIGLTVQTIDNATTITDSTLKDMAQRSATNELDVVKPILLTIGGLGILYVMGKK